MRVQIVSYAGHRGDQVPCRFRLDGWAVEVAEVLDQWLGADYRYFKRRGEDRNYYILRLDGAVGEIEDFAALPRRIVKWEQKDQA